MDPTIHFSGHSGSSYREAKTWVRERSVSANTSAYNSNIISTMTYVSQLWFFCGKKIVYSRSVRIKKRFFFSYFFIPNLDSLSDAFESGLPCAWYYDRISLKPLSSPTSPSARFDPISRKVTNRFWH